MGTGLGKRFLTPPVLLDPVNAVINSPCSLSSPLAPSFSGEPEAQNSLPSCPLSNPVLQCFAVHCRVAVPVGQEQRLLSQRRLPLPLPSARVRFPVLAPAIRPGSQPVLTPRRTAGSSALEEGHCLGWVLRPLVVFLPSSSLACVPYQPVTWLAGASAVEALGTLPLPVLPCSREGWDTRCLPSALQIAGRAFRGFPTEGTMFPNPYF